MAAWRRLTWTGRGDRGEQGFAGGLEGLVFGLLIFVIGTLMVGNAWGVVDTKLATAAAAQQAARTYVEAAGPASAVREAVAAADAALAGYGRQPGNAKVRLLSGSFARCQRITIQVSYTAPLVQLPMIGDVGAGESVSARHSEVVDPYRTGLAGAATCA
jgi:hypothetical protein